MGRIAEWFKENGTEVVSEERRSPALKEGMQLTRAIQAASIALKEALDSGCRLQEKLMYHSERISRTFRVDFEASDSAVLEVRERILAELGIENSGGYCYGAGNPPTILE